MSPQHRVLLGDWRAQFLFGEDEVLATAKSLVDDHKVVRQPGGVVEYFHVLFDRHEIIYSEGALTESFHPGEVGMNALDEDVRQEVLELFPELETDAAAYGPSARASLKQFEGELLASLPQPHEISEPAALNMCA